MTKKLANLDLQMQFAKSMEKCTYLKIFYLLFKLIFIAYDFVSYD